MPGTQQLDAIALANGTPLSFDHVTNSPVSASTAVQTYGFAGHSFMAMTSLRLNVASHSSSVIATFASSAKRPISARSCCGGASDV